MSDTIQAQTRFCAACFDDRQGLTVQDDGSILCRHCVGYRDGFEAGHKAAGRGHALLERMAKARAADKDPCLHPSWAIAGSVCTHCKEVQVTNDDDKVQP